MQHLTTEEIEAGMPHITAAPKDVGTLDLIVDVDDKGAGRIEDLESELARPLMS